MWFAVRRSLARFWFGPVRWVSGPDIDRLRLGNYIAAEQRAGMRQPCAPRGGVVVSNVRSLLPKKFMGLLCWIGDPMVIANERRLLAQAHVVRRLY